MLTRDDPFLGLKDGFSHSGRPMTLLQEDALSWLTQDVCRLVSRGTAVCFCVFFRIGAAPLHACNSYTRRVLIADLTVRGRGHAPVALPRALILKPAARTHSGRYRPATIAGVAKVAGWTRAADLARAPGRERVFCMASGGELGRKELVEIAPELVTCASPVGAGMTTLAAMNDDTSADRLSGGGRRAALGGKWRRLRQTRPDGTVVEL